MTYEKTSIRTRPLKTTPVAGLGGISLFDLYHRYSLPESLILDKERKPIIRHKGDYTVHPFSSGFLPYPFKLPKDNGRSLGLGLFHDPPTYPVEDGIYLAPFGLAYPSNDLEELPLPESPSQPGVVPADPSGLLTVELGRNSVATDDGKVFLSQVHGEQRPTLGLWNFYFLAVGEEIKAQFILRL